MREWSRGQWALRVIVAAGPVVALLACAPTGAPPPAWLVLIVLGLALVHARAPESPFGIGAMGAVVLWWAAALDDRVEAWSLLGAAGLLASHVAAVVAAYGPDRLGVDPATARLWARRGLVALVPAPVVLLTGLLLEGRGEVRTVWVAGLAVALLAAVAGTVVLTREERG
jgi:MYXO-CTERM domain-containing protein